MFQPAVKKGVYAAMLITEKNISVYVAVSVAWS